MDPIITSTVAVLLGGTLLRCTRLGQALFAIGGSENAAALPMGTPLTSGGLDLGYGFRGTPRVGSLGGISPPGSHGTEHDSLPSLRSCHPGRHQLIHLRDFPSS